jgi:hypothetical protein
MGSARHHVSLTLQFAAGLMVETAGERRWQVVSERGSVAYVDVACSLLAARVEEQTSTPGPGAVSPRYNELIAAPALLLEGDVSLPFEVVTIIAVATQ